MAVFTCTITYSNNRAVVRWNPDPTSQRINPGDTVTFTSPQEETILKFNSDSPFESVKGPQEYTVPQGGSLQKVIDNRAKGFNFNFNCLPGGFLEPGSGGHVPVWSGGPGTD
jgi:hypothetical protein